MLNNSRWLKIGAAAMSALALYALAGWLAGPRIFQRQVQQYFADHGGLSVTMQGIRVNPFTFTAAFEGLALTSPQAQPTLTAVRGYADFDLTAGWRPGLNLDLLNLERPDATLEVSPRSTLGPAAWLRDHGLPAVRHVAITEGSLRLVIPGERPRSIDLEQIALTADQLDDQAGAVAKVMLSANVQHAGPLLIDARVGANPLVARGTFEFERLALEPLARMLAVEGWHTEGALSLAGRFDGGERTSLLIADVVVSGEQIGLRDAAGASLLSLNTVLLNGVDIDLRQRRVHAQDISIDGGWVAVIPERWRVVRDALPAATRGLALRADRIRTRNLDLPEVEGAGWRAGGIELEMSDFNSASEARAAFTLAANLNQTARLQASGWLAPGAAELEAELKLTGLELVPLRAQLPLTDELKLNAGIASFQGDFNYRPGGPRLSGRIGVQGLAVIDRSGEPVFAARAADLTGVVIDGSPRRTSVQLARLDRPELRLRMAPGEPLQPRLDALAAEDSALAIRRIEISDGILDFKDARLTPEVVFRATDLGGAIDGLAAAGLPGGASLKLTGRLNETAGGSVTASWRPGDARRQRLIEVALRGIDAPLLGPYATRFAGRAIASGTLDADLRYRYRGNRFSARQRLVVDNLVLGQRSDRANAPELPLDLALALLQDRDRRIEVTVPATARLRDPDFTLGRAVGASLQAFLATLERQPFRTLGALVGDPAGDLGSIVFEAGSAAITDESTRRLTALSDALSQRPAVKLQIAGGYSGQVDRGALARRQVRLHIALATSAGPPGSGEPGPLDYDDTKVRSVLDEFAGERLAATQLTALKARFAGDPNAYYRAAFEAVVDNEPITESALRKLARYRAQAIVGQLSTLGVPAERLRLADPVAIAGADSGVPAALTVTAFNPAD